MNILSKIYCRSYQTIFKIALPFLPYRKPKILESVDKVKDELNNLHINKILLTTDKSIIKLGLTDALIRSLEEANIDYIIFDETVPNPTIDNIEKARVMYLDNNCEGIIALGGGSVMDLAKIVGARLVRPKKSVSKMKGLLHIRHKLPPFFAIPTTAGTGSEVTVAAVITDNKTHEKYPINDFCLIPHFAVLDYKLTLGLPPHLTSTTGLDALTHAVEAYIGNSTTKETRKMAEVAVKLIVENLYTCYIDPTNKDARQNMLLASHYAGIAFTKSYVGYVHAVAHSLGGTYNIPHGLANAVILPIVLKMYGKKIYKKISRLARISNIAKETDTFEVAYNKFIDWLMDMNDKMNIPSSFNEIVKEDITNLAKKASKEANPLYPVPVLMGHKELEEIYMKVSK